MWEQQYTGKASENPIKPISHDHIEHQCVFRLDQPNEPCTSQAARTAAPAKKSDCTPSPQHPTWSDPRCRPSENRIIVEGKDHKLQHFEGKSK